MKIILFTLTLLYLTHSNEAFVTVRVDHLLQKISQLVAFKAKVLESKAQLLKSIHIQPTASAAAASNSAAQAASSAYGTAPQYAQPYYGGYKTFIQNNYYNTGAGALTGSNAASAAQAGSESAANAGSFAGSESAANAGSFAGANSAANAGSFAGANAAANAAASTYSAPTVAPASFAGANSAANAGSFAGANSAANAGANSGSFAGANAASTYSAPAQAPAAAFSGAAAQANSGAAVTAPITNYGLPSNQYVQYLSDIPRAVDVNVGVPIGFVPNVAVAAPGVNFNLN
ncbi:uncharacterized transmembrane protein DDB_G0289901-like [Nilaparvata lugens]|uniref:uncharacterized transmembrane protein DDB_G0289901-like n=1 Tax=Nilaparvata lugens TaxID=108931 RepID=UPI00193E379F|nr:uncharacterized transmembrane protein DDB_G0289901-like [Nilaparvata lugens]